MNLYEELSMLEFRQAKAREVPYVIGLYNKIKYGTIEASGREYRL